MSGTLYVCATPIGNLEDITIRVLRVLKEVDFIAAEDTRHTQKLLNHYDIKTHATSYHEHNKLTKGGIIISRILGGESCAIVTDAGMPGISDPGEDLIRLCYENNIPVTACPGATAAVTALVLSGLPTRRYCFEAFLPVNKKEREHVLESIKNETRTLIFYEAPHRLTDTLEILHKSLGNREIAILRELTKKYETILKGTITDLISELKTTPPKGEIVIVIKGLDVYQLCQDEKIKWRQMPLDAHMKIYLDQGMSEKEAMKKTAKDRGVGKRDIYKELTNANIETRPYTNL